jgi:acyl carrier protein
MTSEEVFNALVNYARRVLDEPPDIISGEMGLREDLNADSLDVLEVIMMFEEESGTSLAEQDVSGVRTFGDLVAVLARTAGVKD